MGEYFSSMKRPFAPLREFLARESASGILLIAAAALGMVIANSPARSAYRSILDSGFTIDTQYFYLSLSVLKIINYILMSLFFFIVGTEIKRELFQGHLSTVKKAAAPFFAALGGMAIPALIYLAVAGDNPSGWAIPVATDIALAVGVVTLAGSRISLALKSFLLALAVIDDIGAIVIIAIFYSAGVGVTWIIFAAITLTLIYLFRKFGYTSRLITTFAAIVIWYCLYRGGIHPTLAGVALGLALPVSEKLEAKLHPLTSFIIVPLFAFANTGITISTDSLSTAINSTLALGIFLGLVLGKPLGILLISSLTSFLGIAELPPRRGRTSLIATGSAAGIGFTVAIFIAMLAFPDAERQGIAIVAIIAASIVSAVLSLALFRAAPVNAND